MNSFLTVKVDKCGKTKQDAITRKLGMLKAEFMKWLFRFNMITLSFQLKYYRMNNNSKRDISFFCTDA